MHPMFSPWHSYASGMAEMEPAAILPGAETTQQQFENPMPNIKHLDSMVPKYVCHIQTMVSWSLFNIRERGFSESLDLGVYRLSGCCNVILGST